MTGSLENQLWFEFFRAEKRVDALCSQARDHLVGTDVAVSIDGRGNEAADTAFLDKSVRGSSLNVQ